MRRCNVEKKKEKKREREEKGTKETGPCPLFSARIFGLVSNDTINFPGSKRTLANTCPRFCLVARKKQGGERRGKVMAWEPANRRVRDSSRLGFARLAWRNFNLPSPPLVYRRGGRESTADQTESFAREIDRFQRETPPPDGGETFTREAITIGPKCLATQRRPHTTLRYDCSSTSRVVCIIGCPPARNSHSRIVL